MTKDDVALIPAAVWMRVVFLSACRVDVPAIVGEVEALFDSPFPRHTIVATIIKEKSQEIKALRSLLHDSITTIGKFWIESGAVTPPPNQNTFWDGYFSWSLDGPSDAAQSRPVQAADSAFDEVAIDELEKYIDERDSKSPGFASLVERALERRRDATQPIVEDEPEDDEEFPTLPVDTIEFDGDGATVHFAKDSSVTVDVIAMLLNSVGRESINDGQD